LKTDSLDEKDYEAEQLTEALNVCLRELIVYFALFSFFSSLP